MAAYDLSVKLAPNIPTREKLEEYQYIGYKSFEQGEKNSGIHFWLQAWKTFKDLKDTDVKFVNELDVRYSSAYSFNEWSNKFEEELRVICHEDKTFLKIRANFCSDFAKVLPESFPDVIEKMLFSEAESYYLMGKKELALKKLNKVIKKFPYISRWKFPSEFPYPYTYQQQSNIRKNEAINKK
ncbi:MAG: hypothetical protein HQK53_11230 [Oligoflexia bacterium]|nr:hypothetical protein [Oligoflexia bacterium]